MKLSEPVFKTEKGVILTQCLATDANELIIPAEVTHINKDAFHSTNAKCIVLPENVKLENKMFEDAEHVESFIIPGIKQSIPTNILSVASLLDDTRKMECLKAMADAEIPLTEQNAKDCYRFGIDGQEQFYIKNYQPIRVFDRPQLTITFEQYQGQLEEAMKKAYNNHVPKIFDSISKIAYAENVSVEEAVSIFDVKKTKLCVDARLPEAYAFVLSQHFDINQMEKIINSELYDPICIYLHQNTEKSVAFAYWIANHLDLDVVNFMDNIEPYYTLIDITPNTSFESVSNQLIAIDIDKELMRIEQDYDVTWDDFEFDLKFCRTETEKYAAYIMEPNDKRMVKLGEYTHCCQKLDEAGETAMMHGLLNPKAGFWVLEDIKNEDIIAQAEIWESKDGNTLVFDNIEFDDDRQIHQYVKPIADWLQACQYENVIMGLGYNNLDHSQLKPAETPELWTTEFEDDVLDGEEIYTDAKESVFMKENGKVSEFFANYKEETKEADDLELD